MKYIITGTGYVSDLVKHVGNEIKVITESALANSELRFNREDLIYVPTESALEIVLKRSDNNKFIDAVDKLKNKYKFRQLMNKLYPDFYYDQTTVDELANLKIPENKRFVVKPVKGFFGTAVKEIDSSSDLTKITAEIKAELAENTKYFSESVLSKNELIVEQYIPGDEYAVDLYYDAQGKPQVLNIYHHPFPEKKEYFHVLYYTNEKLYDKFLGEINTIFTELNTHLEITNFPIHAEFKYEDGNFLPIEMNPLRYGGFGLADLTYHAFGVNPFLAFFQSKIMDWEKIWRERKNHNYAWILAYNSSKADLSKQIPDHELFQEYLGNLLHYVEIDHKENPVFALAYLEDKKMKNLERFLTLEFDRFF